MTENVPHRHRPLVAQPWQPQAGGQSQAGPHPQLGPQQQRLGLSARWFFALRSEQRQVLAWQGLQVQLVFMVASSSRRSPESSVLPSRRHPRRRTRLLGVTGARHEFVTCDPLRGRLVNRP